MTERDAPGGSWATQWKVTRVGKAFDWRHQQHGWFTDHWIGVEDLHDSKWVYVRRRKGEAGPQEGETIFGHLEYGKTKEGKPKIKLVRDKVNADSIPHPRPTMPEGTPVEQPNPEPLDLPEFRDTVRKLAAARRLTQKEYIAAMESAAEADAEYHKVKAKAFMRLKAEGATATEVAETVKGQDEVAIAAIERDKSAALVKGAIEKLNQIDADRASLHKLADWSMRAG